MKIFCITVLYCAIFWPSTASAASFPDVADGSTLDQAALYLKQQEALSGHADGTLRPTDFVNRAAAVKLIVSVLQETNLPTVQGTYKDVQPDQWFAPYVTYAFQELQIITPPDKVENFRPADTVRLAEFIKMLALAHKENPQEIFSEITAPMATDVLYAEEWFYPYMRFGVASSFVNATNNRLDPGAELSREDTIIILYQYLMYKQGRRTQELLMVAENEMIRTLNALQADDYSTAEHASTRGLLAARGAQRNNADAEIVKGAVKISESFTALVHAYQAGNLGDKEAVLRHADTAWNLAGEARKFTSDLALLSAQVQTIAHTIAESVRKSAQ